MDLQQRTQQWHDARKGKLTCSNLGALLGQVSYTSRSQAYRRAIGIDEFVGNDATEWGTNNELNGITAYQTTTGNVVRATGLHVHPHYHWLVGSPDGFVGEEGMIEIKCPFYKKTPHASVPGHYWIQINALLEITGRKWCDFVSWTPDMFVVYRVYKDALTFDFLSQYYSTLQASIAAGASKPPPLSKSEKDNISTRVKIAMLESVNLDFHKCSVDRHTFPEAEEEEKSD